MNFNTSIGEASKMQLDMLLETLAWQHTIVKHLIALEAEKRECGFNEIAGEWEDEKEKTKTLIFEKMYVDNGPDPSADLGLNEQ
ncbi:MAG TPA: hypothetical protein VIQ00_05755 [Chitinophagaceae bacterium]|jgi:hypothetical protein